MPEMFDNPRLTALWESISNLCLDADVDMPESVEGITEEESLIKWAEDLISRCYNVTNSLRDSHMAAAHLRSQMLNTIQQLQTTVDHCVVRSVSSPPEPYVGNRK